MSFIRWHIYDTQGEAVAHKKWHMSYDSKDMFLRKTITVVFYPNGSLCIFLTTNVTNIVYFDKNIP